MSNNFAFDAVQAEIAYRTEQLHETRRNVRLQKRRNIRWFGRRAGVAQQPVQEQVRAPAPRVNPTQHEQLAKEKSEVSVG